MKAFVNNEQVAWLISSVSAVVNRDCLARGFNPRLLPSLRASSNGSIAWRSGVSWRNYSSVHQGSFLVASSFATSEDLSGAHERLVGNIILAPQ
jgi:hypothetical protein